MVKTAESTNAPQASREKLLRRADQLKQRVLKSGLEAAVGSNHLEILFSEEKILGEIDTYFTPGRVKEINERLGNEKEGTIISVMNSAKLFADICSNKLGVDRNRVVEINVTTYIEGESNGEGLSKESQAAIIEQIIDKGYKKVLIFEDMIDSGNTLQHLVKFLTDRGIEVEVICLFDKQNPKSDVVRANLEENEKCIGIDCIMKTGDKFIIGFGIDYYMRLCNELKCLYQVIGEEGEDSFRAFKKIMKPYVNALKAIELFEKSPSEENIPRLVKALNIFIMRLNQIQEETKVATEDLVSSQ